MSEGRIPIVDIPGDAFDYDGLISPHVDHDAANLRALVAYFDAAAAVGRRRVITQFAEVTAAQSAGALGAFKDIIDQSTEALSVQANAVANELAGKK